MSDGDGTRATGAPLDHAPAGDSGPEPGSEPGSGSERRRLFLALEVPADAAAAIAAGLAPLRGRHKAKWTGADAFHLTLAFLGDIDPVDVPGLAALASEVAAPVAPFAVATGRGGGVRRLRDGTAGLGIDAGAATVRALADACATGAAAVLGPDGPAPRRAPAPHLTVARKASQALIDDLAAEAGGPVHVGWTAERIVLLRSHLDPDRARYALGAAAPLGERP
ncbi:MAG: RNA 2',3'-cyclic phosphodiesterase [Chloroflexota bacterium]